MELEIRKAKVEEAPLIAHSILSAMHMEEDVEAAEIEETLNRICALPDTLYSWRNTLVATVDGAFAGSITSYGGNTYKEVRDYTFSLFGRRVTLNMDDETGSNEYYLDSLAVLPQFRTHGIGRELILQAMESGEALGFYTASLIVESGAENLIRLYTKCGFTVDESAHSKARPELPAGHLWCFGMDYLRMIAPLH